MCFPLHNYNFCELIVLPKNNLALGNRKGDRQTPSGGQPHPDRSLLSTNSSPQQWASLLNSRAKLTTQRYWYMTVFVDQHSQFAYVYLQWTITSAETVQAKHSFKCMAEDMGVCIHHNHADNGRFADKGFVQDCQKQHQGPPIAESMPTSKMALRRRKSAISRNRHG